MEAFDPYAVKVPWLQDLTIEECRQMPAEEKIRRLSAAFPFVRQKHREWIWQRDPYATEQDIVLDWFRLSGVKEEMLTGLMLAHEEEFLDKPILVLAHEILK